MNKAITRAMRARAKAWPQHLAPLPESEWPSRRPGMKMWPVALNRSRHYLVQVFEEGFRAHVEVLRLSINRVVLTREGWEQNIPWEELMRCKREAGYADWYGIEVYPREKDVVNVANMRHLWLLSEPLAIGWFDGETGGGA